MMVNGDLMLWRSVLIQAIKDATSKRNPNEKWEAIAWFMRGDKDFRLVCELAELEPNSVRNFVCKKLF